MMPEDEILYEILMWGIVVSVSLGAAILGAWIL